MSGLMHEMGVKALRLGVPLGVQLDLTYRCNERCVHCYLDHDDHGEMSTAEIKDLLGQIEAIGIAEGLSLKQAHAAIANL